MSILLERRKLAARAFLLSLCILAFALVEIGGRLQYRLSHGHPVQEDMAYAPHEGLVFIERGNPFLVPEESRAAGKIRLWVLGGSTSAPLPDRSDWPSQLARRLTAAAPGKIFVLNWARPSYGSGHISWLYEHHRDEVLPSAILVSDGWNMRGALTSPYAPHPENTCTRFDGPIRCFSAWLVRHSNAYARVAVGVHKRMSNKINEGCEDARDEDKWGKELTAWEIELRETLAKAARRDRVFLILFPGLGMRGDAKDVVSRKFPCAGRHWERTRADYALRIEALQRIASDLGLPTLDARFSYRKLSPERFVSLFTDGAHQNKEGNRLLGNSVYEEFRKYGPWQ